MLSARGVFAYIKINCLSSSKRGRMLELEF